MITLCDNHIMICTDTLQAMETIFDVCGFGRIPAKDVRFYGFIKGERENDKN